MAVENIGSVREQEVSGGSGQENSVARRGNLKASASSDNFLQSGLSTITTIPFILGEHRRDGMSVVAEKGPTFDQSLAVR